MHRAELGLERALCGIEDLGADDIAGQQVGGALDAAELRLNGIRDSPCRSGFGQPRHALQQHVTTGEQTDQ
ncbi:Uncharacterised protein [Mycobacteroides abscessus subsp. abscessus]|nr:Uncharacterised protein [Mycobacteroides abscessus subsp. abscessus]